MVHEVVRDTDEGTGTEAGSAITTSKPTMARRSVKAGPHVAQVRALGPREARLRAPRYLQQEKSVCVCVGLLVRPWDLARTGCPSHLERELSHLVLRPKLNVFLYVC
jgi:hypothetical protein